MAGGLRSFQTEACLRQARVVDKMCFKYPVLLFTLKFNHYIFIPLAVSGLSPLKSLTKKQIFLGEETPECVVC